MTASEAIRALCAEWERGDPDALAGLFSEDGVYEDPLMEGPLVGREQIREGSRPAMAAITDCRVEIRHLLGDGAVAMGEGFFASRLADGSGRLDFPFAITAEMKGTSSRGSASSTTRAPWCSSPAHRQPMLGQS